MGTCTVRLIAGILLSGFAGLTAAPALAQEELFNYRQVRSSMPVDTGPATVAEYEAVVNVSALARSERDVIELQLPDGSRFVAVPMEIEYRGKESFAWRGKLKGDNGKGHGVITIHQGYVAGRLLFPGRNVFELVPGPEQGVARLLELDSSMFPEDEEDEISIPGARLQKLSSPISTPTNTSIFPPGSAPIIDVMAVYTPMARQSAGGTAQIEARIQGAVDITNDGYANSEVYQRINLIHMQEVPYDGGQNGLSWVRNDPLVASLRNQYQADLVALISAAGSGCGVAYGMSNPGPAFEAYAFSRTSSYCLAGNTSFAHELGHNMGLSHEPANGPDPAMASYPWSFGHDIDIPNGGWVRTIMSYGSSCQSHCEPRGPHFSNPNVAYNGAAPTGIEGERDNARTLNLTSHIVANFRKGDWLFSNRFEERGHTLSGYTNNIVNSSGCTTSDWSSAVGIGSVDAGVQGSTNRRYGGPCGLHVGVTNAAYLVSDHPESEDSYNVRFYAFLDDATGFIKLFDTLDSSNNEIFSVWYLNGNVTLQLATTTGYKLASFSNIDSGWHSIHVNWESASNANVEFLVANSDTVSGSEQVISGNTSTLSINRARLGSVDGTGGGGSFDFDDFMSTRIVPPTRLLVGDANNDTNINVFDLGVVTSEITGGDFAGGQPDCNEDGNINSQDTTCIANLNAGN